MRQGRRSTSVLVTIATHAGRLTQYKYSSFVSASYYSSFLLSPQQQLQQSLLSSFSSIHHDALQPLYSFSRPSVCPRRCRSRESPNATCPSPPFTKFIRSDQGLGTSMIPCSYIIRSPSPRSSSSSVVVAPTAARTAAMPNHWNCTSDFR